MENDGTVDFLVYGYMNRGIHEGQVGVILYRYNSNENSIEAVSYTHLYPSRTEYISIDGAFPVLHGKNGEDGTVQGLLKLAGIPIIGCEVLSSAVCMDKDIAHIVARSAGIKTPASVVIKKDKSDKEIEELSEVIGFPLFRCV